MSKEKKKSQPVKKNNLFSEKDEYFSKERLETSEKSRNEKSDGNFLSDLEESVKDLWYMSETDSEISVFRGGRASVVSSEELKRELAIPAEEKIEERDFKDFFENLTKIQDWYEDEERLTAQRFSKLENLLEENLKNLKVFKIGQIEIDIYAVGLDSQNNLTGIKTHAVET